MTEIFQVYYSTGKDHNPPYTPFDSGQGGEGVIS